MKHFSLVLLVIIILGEFIQSNKLLGFESVQLVEINQKTGEVKPYGTKYSFLSTSPYVFTVDYDDHIISLISYNSSSWSVEIVGINYDSGDLVYDLWLPFIETSTNIGMGETIQYNHQNGYVYVVGIQCQPSLNHLWEINPKTGEMNPITTFTSNRRDTLSFLDEKRSFLYTQNYDDNGNAIFDKIDVSNDYGKITYVDDPYNLTLLVESKDGSKDNILGIGKDDDDDWVLVSYDIGNDKWEEISDLSSSGFDDFLKPTAAYDGDNDELTVLGEKNSGSYEYVTFDGKGNVKGSLECSLSDSDDCVRILFFSE